jgi:hypothetical protein
MTASFLEQMLTKYTHLGMLSKEIFFLLALSVMRGPRTKGPAMTL